MYVRVVRVVRVHVCVCVCVCLYNALYRELIAMYSQYVYVYACMCVCACALGQGLLIPQGGRPGPTKLSTLLAPISWISSS